MARILIVDDDPVFGGLTERRLERAGYAVSLRGGPLGTLAELKKGSFDLLLLDLRMPALSGADIVRMVQSRSGVRSTRIVLYSSVDTDTLGSIARSLGVDGHASKSAPFTHLVGVIESVLARDAAAARLHGGERGAGAANPPR
ncbi:response regulator [Polyangium aurulentum]|uniref:response regulator n=1 Tax=Polyangium aurulentum TaxID=2567896 RepID=UPI0010AEAC84|nr:response regulator [Polyangium aurulentum]UQA57737.1 response regulator [Polyangium aurulentum]